MPKEKVSFSFRILHTLKYHPWLKVISLILAVVLWFYAKGELERFY